MDAIAIYCSYHLPIFSRPSCETARQWYNSATTCNTVAFSATTALTVLRLAVSVVVFVFCIFGQPISYVLNQRTCTFFERPSVRLYFVGGLWSLSATKSGNQHTTAQVGVLDTEDAEDEPDHNILWSRIYWVGYTPRNGENYALDQHRTLIRYRVRNQSNSRPTAPVSRYLSICWAISIYTKSPSFIAVHYRQIK